jgi:hypothetical protein
MSALPAYELGREFSDRERKVLQRFIEGEDFSDPEREQLAFCFRRARHQYPRLTAKVLISAADRAGTLPGDLCLVSFWQLAEVAAKNREKRPG